MSEDECLSSLLYTIDQREESALLFETFDDD